MLAAVAAGVGACPPTRISMSCMLARLNFASLRRVMETAADELDAGQTPQGLVQGIASRQACAREAQQAPPDETKRLLPSLTPNQGLDWAMVLLKVEVLLSIARRPGPVGSADEWEGAALTRGSGPC